MRFFIRLNLTDNEPEQQVIQGLETCLESLKNGKKLLDPLKGFPARVLIIRAPGSNNVIGRATILPTDEET